MNPESPIRLICFDLGGVLVRICRSWYEGCAAAGIEPRGECVNGFPPIQGWDELVAQFSTGRIDGPTWSSRTSELSQNLYSALEIKTIHDAWMINEYEGVGEVIDHIHAAGYQTAALSNTNHDHWIRMDEFPAVMRLQHRFASHEMGLLKPDPAIYREFERRLNRRASEILFFDDLPPNVEAARALGWTAELIDHRGRTDLQILAAMQNNGLIRAREAASGPHSPV